MLEDHKSVARHIMSVLVKSKEPMSAKVRVFSKIMAQVSEERQAQDARWGEQNHPFEYWNCILMEEIGEVSKAFMEKDDDNLRVELVQCAAVLMAMIECGDRNLWWLE
jgi:NTP pyrophosphatase (non-canonical NTP hydrolase)